VPVVDRPEAFRLALEVVLWSRSGKSLLQEQHDSVVPIGDLPVIQQLGGLGFERVSRPPEFVVRRGGRCSHHGRQSAADASRRGSRVSGNIRQSCRFLAQQRFTGGHRPEPRQPIARQLGPRLVRKSPKISANQRKLMSTRLHEDFALKPQRTARSRPHQQRFPSPVRQPIRGRNGLLIRGFGVRVPDGPPLNRSSRA
jgi:hypothetical protein